MFVWITLDYVVDKLWITLDYVVDNFVKYQTFVLLWITLHQTRVRFLSCDTCQVYATINTNVINVYHRHCTYTNEHQKQTNEHQR